MGKKRPPALGTDTHTPTHTGTRLFLPTEHAVCQSRLQIKAMIRTGKYKGLTFEEVKERDKRYCGWLLEADSLPRDLQKFAASIEREHGGLLRVGKHRGEWYNDVWKARPDYFQWAANLKEPFEPMKKVMIFCSQPSKLTIMHSGYYMEAHYLF